MRLLIVEDEKGLADGLKALLENQGYCADAVYDGQSGLDYAQSGIYDAVLLDIMLPKLNGLDVLRRLRNEKCAVPVLLLTAKSEVDDKIKGLDCGADDYITKPFDAGEFLARVRALTRRRSEYVEKDLEFGDIRLSMRTQELCSESAGIKLGRKEYDLMECLLINQNQIVTKDILCEKVWGPDDSTEYNSVEVYVSFLRKKLAHLRSSVQIKATRGVGYSLETGKASN